jgi:FAD/FMN-containing dehydrogenase
VTSTARAPRERLVPPGGHECHRTDLTATVSAELTLSDFQSALAPLGQWAPIDGPGGMPIGRLIEIDSTGPMRLGFGAWRDLLLGVQFTNGRGELITAGGRTVKNVAGYDLTKFMVGQCRVFGTIETATMRTYRRPAGAIVARFAPDPAIAARLLATPLRPQWATLGRDHLLLGYVGDEAMLEYVAGQLPTTEPMDLTRRTADEAIGGKGGAGWPIPEKGMLLRVSLPPKKVADWARTLGERPWMADPIFGIVILPLDNEADIEPLAASAESAGGTVRVFADLESAPRLVRVSTNAGERQIIQQLKHAFDPENRLQPLVI